MRLTVGLPPRSSVISRGSRDDLFENLSQPQPRFTVVVRSFVGHPAKSFRPCCHGVHVMSAFASSSSSSNLYDEGSRMTSVPSRKNFRSMNPVLEPSIIGLGHFLRAKHPRDTATCVEADTGVSAGTVEKWLQGIAFPRAVHQFRLIGAYGPSVFAAMMPSAPRWLDEAVRRDELERMKAEHTARAALIAHLEEGT
jgi:hypothetical protein